MPRRSTRPPLILVPNERDLLERLRNSHTAPRRAVQRAQVLWRYHTGESIAAIMHAVHLTRKSVAKWVSKALRVGVAAGLQDTPHGSPPKLTEEAKAWVVHLACSQPKELGYAAELWTRQALAQHVRREALAAGHPSLARAGKATVHRILVAQPLQPHKVTYYLQRRDPAFESKMREVLLVYQEVALQNQPGEPGMLPLKVVTVSVDEKPGVQAISNTTPDLPPVPGKHPTVARDHEYKRLGTCSILAALDLHTGHVTGRVERRPRSREFIALLRDLDAYYPKDCTMLIRLLPKRESANISELCSPGFHFRHRCRTSCGFSRMTQRVRRTWRRSGGPRDSSVSTVGGMASRAVSRTAPPSYFDVAVASVTRRSLPILSCSARTRRSRSGFGPRTSYRAKRPALALCSSSGNLA